MIVVNAIMKTNDNNFETIKNAVKELEIKTREEDGCLMKGLFAYTTIVYHQVGIMIAYIFQPHI